MTKQYKRGSTANNFKSLKFYYYVEWPEGYVDYDTVIDKTATAHQIAKKWGKVNHFLKTMIIRGIGYRAFTVSNDLLVEGNASSNQLFIETFRPVYTFANSSDLGLSISSAGTFELINTKYLIVRAGHTRDMVLPLSPQIFSTSFKKDRKLVIHSRSSQLTANISKNIWQYRQPSVYTGRGVRIKHVKPLRKAGKKDKQKGKTF